MLKKNILIICNSNFISGAEISLNRMLQDIDKDKFNLIVLLSKRNQLQIDCNSVSFIYLPMIWFTKTFNPLMLAFYIWNVLLVSYQIRYTIKINKIDLVYSNTFKSHIYGAISCLFLKVRSIYCARDRVFNNIFFQFIHKRTSRVICISNYINNQIDDPIKTKLVYGGIDVKEWESSNKEINLNINKNKTVIAIIAQLTPWKNHEDFIKVSDIVISINPKVHFLIVGDILHPQDKKYKDSILRKIQTKGVGSYFSYLGHRQNDLREILNEIDIIIHPAINEPFGRVIIEAMAMEKPVVAYNCGGPAEIVVDGETGFLVEPCNYQQLAEKTMKLIENQELRYDMGKAGRQRVVEKFKVERYVREMEEVFDSI